MILTGATGCDNVAWGGAEWRLVAPPTAEPDSAVEASAEAVEGTARRSYGPFLLAGTRDGARATLALVGEVQRDGLLPLGGSPEEAERVRQVMAEGSEWIVFADGVRVGRLIADGTGSAAQLCPARPTVSGMIELVPPATSAERLLALPAVAASERSYDAFTPLEDVYDQRVATLTWAGEAIPRNQAAWPAEGLVAARQDIQVFQPRGSSGPAIAATFMYRDQLSVAPPSGQGAYALFILGSRAGQEYRESFAWYRPVDAEGKGAPRFFDHLDWDGDGDSDVLLEVLGAQRRWFAALGLRGGQWVRTFQDECGVTPAAGG